MGFVHLCQGSLAPTPTGPGPGTWYQVSSRTSFSAPSRISQLLWQQKTWAKSPNPLRANVLTCEGCRNGCLTESVWGLGKQMQCQGCDPVA